MQIRFIYLSNTSFDLIIFGIIYQNYHRRLHIHIGWIEIWQRMK